MEDRIYCCIDLKSFYASVECVERGLDPFKENLVVADPDRSKGTICLAITPAMKKLGIKNRCRLFEIPEKVKYVVAKPRMKLYMEKSLEIYSVYLNYISSDDILVYSIDECFIDLTDYVKIYSMSAVSLAKLLTEKVYEKTGIRATVGVGTNLFLAKVALDVTAKKSPDFIGILDEQSFKKDVWHHKPITDIWNIGPGIAERLKKHGLYDLYDVAHYPEEPLYREFGVNAELLIDHANGIEPCTISDVKNYKSKSNSISTSQVLFRDYSFSEAETVLKEMVDSLCLELVEKGLVTDNISLFVGYSEKEKSAAKSMKISGYTDSFKKIMSYFSMLFNKIVDKNKTVRKIGVGLNDVKPEEYKDFDMFYDEIAEEKEKSMAKTVIKIKEKFGKNSILKGTSFKSEATQKERNKMIGGHNAGEDE